MQTGDDKGADRSSIEIKTLLRKLHPQHGNHKDRIRRLKKFRNYVSGDSKRTPDFYDDDIPLLFMGAFAPAIYLEEVQADVLAGLYGLVPACGTRSGEKQDGIGLKRSARNALQLLKWLVLDWREVPPAPREEDNLFCSAFLSLEASAYHHMHLDLHLIGGKGDDRGGAKEEACEILVLILTKHMSPDGESLQPLLIEELLSTPKAQQEFELWLPRNTSASVQDVINKNAAARQQELALQQRQDALANKALGIVGADDLFLDESDNEDDSEHGKEDAEDSDSEGADDADDVMAAMRKRKKAMRKELKEAEGRGELVKSHGVATRWVDSQLARERRAREASAARAGQHDTIRDSQAAVQEFLEREEEKSKILSKDPLAIINEDGFDLRNIEKSQAEQMEQALHELQEEVQRAEATNNEKIIKRAMAKKESLEAFIDRLGGIDALENEINLAHSVLPTNPKFDPVLLLTLVHRQTPYNTLVGCMGNLSNKTENQVEQLQNLVRDNFPLFVRCAEGFEEFRQSTEDEVGLGFNERIDKLEAIAESCAFQAKKSFKPLLDNASEVRKVQSAMNVLQRVAPILQVPALMRQHIENRRYSQALKTYRRVLVVDKSVEIELLKHVKSQAEECVHEARHALESRLAQDRASVEELLEGIRDTDELISLTETPVGIGKGRETKIQQSPSDSNEQSPEARGYYDIDGVTINVREHPPALACLLLQAAHFSAGVRKIIDDAELTTQRIFAGESLVKTQNDLEVPQKADDPDQKPSRASGNQWKYDILDARVVSTIKSVAFIRQWLQRLIRIGKAAREDEKRRAARLGRTRPDSRAQFVLDDNQLTAFEVFISNITPSLTRLVEHTAFCALGSNSRSGSKDVTMTFGQSVPDKLRTLLRSPLPPSQSTKVGKELAALLEILSESSGEASALRGDRDSSSFQLSPLDECQLLADAAVITIEKRRCIYAFDVCSRACSNRASGSGRFDADALVSCLQNLAEQLSHPDQCSNEVEKGCELVIRRCCEGLATYVRDRGDSARLSAVAECADVMSERVGDIVREASVLTDNGLIIQEVISEDIMGLESAMFEEFLESIRLGVANSVRVGWLDADSEKSGSDSYATAQTSFPGYLSASLMAIVRCRAQVEQALSDKIRVSEGVPYQHLAMATVSDGVVEGICNEIINRKATLKVRQADRLANELEFLKNTLKKFLGDKARSLLESTREVVASKAGRGRDFKGDGPDGLAALEELERLGRVYVLCLGE